MEQDQIHTEPERNTRFSFTTILRYFNLFMPLFYIGLGITVLVKNSILLSQLPSQYKLYLGIALIVYGVFRGYRVIQNKEVE